MKKNIKKGLVIAFGFLFLNPAFSFAENHSGKKGHHHEKKIERMKEHLGLSEEQVTQIKNIHQKYKTDKRAQKKIHRGLKEDLNTLLKSDAKEAEILAKHAELQKSKMEMGKIKLNKILSIRETLSAEQREKFIEMKKHRHHGHHKDKECCDSKKSCPYKKK